MGKARVLRDEVIWFNEARFEARITVLDVPRSSKFPDGIKLKCVLIDVENGIPRVLLDNHEPHGYHLHTKLPEDKNYRVSLDIKEYNEAIRLFMKEVRKVIEYEE